MAKVTIKLCDVKPCTFAAEREFEVNGQLIYVCGESCFVKFWSREYGSWKASNYKMRVFQDLPSQPSLAAEIPAVDIVRSDLHIVKPALSVGVGGKS